MRSTPEGPRQRLGPAAKRRQAIGAHQRGIRSFGNGRVLGGMPGGDEERGLTADDLLDRCRTLIDLHEAVAVVVLRERDCPHGLIAADGRLTRAGLDTALTVLGLPVVSDEEWRAINLWCSAQ